MKHDILFCISNSYPQTAFRHAYCSEEVSFSNARASSWREKRQADSSWRRSRITAFWEAPREPVGEPTGGDAGRGVFRLLSKSHGNRSLAGCQEGVDERIRRFSDLRNCHIHRLYRTGGPLSDQRRRRDLIPPALPSTLIRPGGESLRCGPISF